MGSTWFILISAPDDRDILVDYDKQYKSVSARRGGAEGAIRLHPTTDAGRSSTSRDVWGKYIVHHIELLMLLADSWYNIIP